MTKIQFAFVTLLSAVAAQNLSAVDLKVINDTGSPVNVFVRGRDASTFYLETVPQNTTHHVAVSSEKLENKPIFEVISAKNDTNIPDWKLLSGTCFNLDSTKDHTILIENSTLGIATSCKIVE
ncbi:hypothetical protein Bealeia2_01913 (plasmid) [Candidatus Bealeia paramacronuclearis]|uniref:hypothetical protein n=1 Tax=Candidatus Bealeia paramacronuclearis TaxID=1921001 RepID=UPI002C9DFA1D|nr:hypothetical protein [Candidatus Bealeia paramacronuclearis]